MIGLRKCGRYTHNGTLLRNIAICSNMDGPREYYVEWNTSEKEIVYDITYTWNLKNTNKYI